MGLTASSLRSYDVGVVPVGVGGSCLSGRERRRDSGPQFWACADFPASSVLFVAACAFSVCDLVHVSVCCRCLAASLAVDRLRLPVAARRATRHPPMGRCFVLPPTPAAAVDGGAMAAQHGQGAAAAGDRGGRRLCVGGAPADTTRAGGEDGGGRGAGAWLVPATAVAAGAAGGRGAGSPRWRRRRGGGGTGAVRWRRRPAPRAGAATACWRRRPHACRPVLTGAGGGAGRAGRCPAVDGGGGRCWRAPPDLFGSAVGDVGGPPRPSDKRRGGALHRRRRGAPPH